jgi:stearoyl-CoA desaturase (delta-9 desaturase)
MSTELFDFLSRGLTQASLWQLLLVLVVGGQLTMMSTTLYLHRSVSHRGVDYHPVVAHWFRFWSWLTTGMITKEWAAIHRKHHARCETAEDPHSPRFQGIGEVLWRGTELYRKAALDRDEIARYGKGTPDDWIERNLYSRVSAQIGINDPCVGFEIPASARNHIAKDEISSKAKPVVKSSPVAGDVVR